MLEIKSVFKKQKPRQFSYKPLYYDPEQEERDLRDSLHSNEPKKEYVPGSLVKGIRMERYKNNDPKNREKISTDARNRVILRLLIVLFLLFMIGYIIMNSTILETMFTVFQKM